MEAAQNLSKNLKALRTLRGYSLARCAMLTGVSKSTLHEIEQGQTPRLDTVEQIARAFGLPVTALLSDTLSSVRPLQSGCAPQGAECGRTWTREDLETLLLLCRKIALLFRPD